MAKSFRYFLLLAIFFTLHPPCIPPPLSAAVLTLQLITQYPWRPVKHNDKSVTSLSASKNRKTHTKGYRSGKSATSRQCFCYLKIDLSTTTSDTFQTTSLTWQMTPSFKDSSKTLPSNNSFYFILLYTLLYFIFLLLERNALNTSVIPVSYWPKRYLTTSYIYHSLTEVAGK